MGGFDESLRNEGCSRVCDIGYVLLEDERPRGCCFEIESIV